MYVEEEGKNYIQLGYGARSSKCITQFRMKVKCRMLFHESEGEGTSNESGELYTIHEKEVFQYDGNSYTSIEEALTDELSSEWKNTILDECTVYFLYVIKPGR